MPDIPPQLAMLAKRLNRAVEDIKQAIHEQTEAIRAKNEQEGQSDHPPPEIRTEIHLPENVERERTKQKEKEYTIQKWNVVIAAATFIIVAVYAGISWYQACLMREAITASRDIFTIGQRPWLGIDGVPTMAQNERGGWIIDSRTKNFGLSVGLRYVYATNPIFGAYSGGLEAPIETACKRGEDLTLSRIGLPIEHPIDHGYAVFPGNSMKNQSQTLGDDTAVTFIGCLTYLDEFAKIGDNPTVHHTPFCYNVRQPVFIGEEMTPCFSVKSPD